jgi:hypothetical protein
MFVFTALQDEFYRNRTFAVAETWGKVAADRMLEDPQRLSISYLVDPMYRHAVESVLPSSQIVEWEQPHNNHSGVLYNARLQALPAAFHQKAPCDWVVVPEDDTYVNVDILMSKLDCLSPELPEGTPRLMGELHIYNNSHSHEWEDFVHGSGWIMNAAAVPVLAKVSAKRNMAERNPYEYGDVAVAEVLREEFGYRRE